MDRKIARLAARQQGYVTRRQLLDLGLTPRQIEYRLFIGRLIAVYAGVYAVGHLPRTWSARASAAVLACEPEATLSHGSAASLWGIDPRWHLPFEVIVPGHRRRAGITIHSRIHLAPQDRRHHHGVWVTSPARAILDVAVRLSDRELQRAVDSMRVAGWLHPGALAELLTRVPRHRSASRMRALFGAGEPRNPTRSELELAFLALVEAYGLPAPLVNVRVNGYEVDALFPAEKVIVELDGWTTHGTRAAFEADRERDAAHAETGHLTVRVTHERATKRPAREAERLHRILATRRGP